MIYHLVYLSEKDPSFYKEGMVNAIVEKSQQNNKLKEVTGILINNGKFFIQLLEGNKENVQRIYKKIMMDNRHQGVRILMEFTDTERLFPEWAMGLANTETKDEEDAAKLIRDLRLEIIRGHKSEKSKVINLLKKFNNRKTAPTLKVRSKLA